MSNLRTLVESELFKRQLESFGDVEWMDEALDAIAWALARKPEACPVIPDTAGLRVIKTLKYERNGKVIPVLKVWFSIMDDSHVLLRAITRQDIEESADLDI